MRAIFCALFVTLLINHACTAQITPLENRVLNYRIIGFSLPKKANAASYTLEIAAGSINSEDSFRRNIIRTKQNKANEIIAEVPAFGQQYTWRAVYQMANKTIAKSVLYHFSTGMINEVNPEITKLRVTQPALKYKDAYVFLDGNKALYDMTGKPVWYLPMIDGKTYQPSDLKLTSRGTITFLANVGYEINYDGEVLWKTPATASVNGEGEERFHHDFTRLENGHYMILGQERVKLPSKYNNLSPTNDKGELADADVKNNVAKFGTLIEYDERGNVVWSWKSSKYFLEPEVISQIAKDRNLYDVHENSFYFDENEKIIYLSLRSINTLLKLKYPEGTIVNSYGETTKPGDSKKGEKLFCGQHSVSRSKQGCIFIFNNNGCTPAGPPKIKLMKEPTLNAERLKVIWEYQCSADGRKATNFLSGGNVTELPDGSMFVCMGGNYSKVFIVNKEKKILWSALPERDEGNTLPDNIHQYRASIIDNPKKLTALIWGTLIKKNALSCK